MVSYDYIHELRIELEEATLDLGRLEDRMRRIEAQIKEAKELLQAQRLRESIANGGMP